MKFRRIAFIATFLVILIVLIFHIQQYIFLCDDAFISFRYAQNCANGEGLVFNPGEKVEGYTNFLWVLILALFSTIGMAPENIANILSITISISLFLLLFHFNRKLFSESRYDLFILIAPILLAFNRTYAVWSTGGLETKLFSLLIFIAVIALIKARTGEIKYLRYSALLFALASLTRPEGILLFGSFWGFFLLFNIKEKAKVRQILQASILFIILIGAHFVFRYVYYGYLFPNTFYAKVTGAWFESGFMYLFAYFHEYGLYLLLLPVIFIFSKDYGKEKRNILYSITVPFVPYLFYLSYIGGDHFEFRPMDLTIPFMAVVIQEGLRSAYKNLANYNYKLIALILPVYGILALWLYTVPGWLSHNNFPAAYDSGIGVYSSRQNNILARIPGFHQYLKLYDNIHAGLASHFVCIRQEEHKLAFEQVFKPQAMLLKKAIENNIIRREEIISLWCVGAIPYYSNLTTIDYLGLTDSYVAHRQLPDIPEKLLPFDKLMAHQKRADWNYLKARKVTYISTQPAKFFFQRNEYLRGNQLIEDKLPRGAYLVPAGEYVFVFKSIYIPEYFKYHMNSRGIDFFYRTAEGEVQFYPGKT